MPSPLARATDIARLVAPTNRSAMMGKRTKIIMTTVGLITEARPPAARENNGRSPNNDIETKLITRPCSAAGLSTSRPELRIGMLKANAKPTGIVTAIPMTTLCDKANPIIPNACIRKAATSSLLLENRRESAPKAKMPAVPPALLPITSNPAESAWRCMLPLVRTAPMCAGIPPRCC